MKFNDTSIKGNFIPNLNEIFDTKIPVEDWKIEDNVRIGTLIIDDATYLIELDPRTFALEQKQYRFINVVFKKIVDGIPSEDLTFNSKTGSKVLGAITHAVRDELKNFDADAIVFIATDHVDQWLRVYNKLVSNLNLLTGEFSSALKDVALPVGKMTIIFNRRISSAEKNNFIEHLKQQEK